MIIEQIYNGISAEELGISDIEYASRKSILDEFLKEHTWDSLVFLGWLSTRPESQPAPSKNVESESFPDIATMAKTATMAASEFVIDGFKSVPREVHKDRLSVCDSCEYLVHGRCKKCGCYMSLKAWLPKQKCPVNKWMESSDGV